MQVETIKPIKSTNDDRQYQAIVLKNQMKILLIHDPILQKSACSLSVGVGSLQDYDRSLGIAHLLQHMLFMGSKKYPSQNQYPSFISLNSGNSNAYTSDEQTNYYFDIATSVFKQAIQRFTDFFKGALLLEECIQKETKAVHQQYTLWTNDDNCIKWEILRTLAQGPYNRFSIGNNQTLTHSQIRTDLCHFYDQHYSSNHMNVVLCSNLPITTMKSEFFPFLQEIPNKNKPPLQYEVPFRGDNLGKMVIMQSIKDQCFMQFFWVVQHLRMHYKKHIDDYITHVLGHQAKNSLISILRQKQYASHLSCYKHHLMSQTIIGLQIKLTQQGQDNMQQIYNIVIDYVGSLKAESTIYEQIHQQSQIDFEFKQKKQPSRQVYKLSERMHYVPLDEILNNRHIFSNFDKDMLNRVMGQLNPFNLIVLFSSHQEVKNHQIQKYLGGRYRVQHLPQRKRTGLIFQQLQTNVFLPMNLSLAQKNYMQKPIQILPNVVFMNRQCFNICKGGVQITVNGPQKSTFRQFYCQYLQMLLKQIIYNAEVLHLSLNFDTDDNLCLQIFGFNDVIQKLLKIISTQLMDLHTSKRSQTLFNLSLQNLIQEYQNFYCQQVDDIAQSYLQKILRNSDIDVKQIIKELQTYDYNQITKRIKQFWKQSSISYVFVGNFQINNIKSVVAQLQQQVGGKKHYPVQQIKCLHLNKPLKHVTYLSTEQISTSGCIVYFQAGPFSIELYYLIQLLNNYISEPFFDELRTNQQMAYSLNTIVNNTRGVLGMYFILASSTRDPQQISIAINTVVRKIFAQMDQKLTQQNLNKLKQSVKTKITTPHNNLKQLFQFICKQINRRTFYFNKKQPHQVDTYLNAITKQQLKSTAQKLLTKSLQIYVVSKQHQKMFKQHTLSNHFSFKQIKKQASYYQDFIAIQPIKLQ